MIRKLMLVAAVAMLVLPNAVNAQSTVNATATVGNFSDVTGSGDLDFGTLIRNTDNVVDAVTQGPQRLIDYNHDVTVTFSAPTVLTGTGDDLAVTLMCAAQIGAGAPVTEACTTASFDLAVGGTLTQATLFFGGTIAEAAVNAAAAGSYSGTITIQVAPTGT